MAELKLDATLDEIARRFPGALPTCKLDDKRTPAILRELHHHFPGAFLEDKIKDERVPKFLGELKELLPEAFPGSKVNWERLGHYLYNSNARVDTSLVGMLRLLKLKFNYAFGQGAIEINSRQTKEILEELMRRLPDALPNFRLDDSQADALLEYLQRECSEAFTDGKVDWIEIVRKLYPKHMAAKFLRNQAPLGSVTSIVHERDKEQRMKSILKEPKRILGANFPVSRVSDERVPMVLLALRNHFPSIPTLGENSGDRAHMVLTLLRYESPRSFAQDTIDWEKFAHFLYDWQADVLRLADKSLDELLAEFRRHFSGSLPSGKGNDPKLPAVLKELRYRLPNLFLIDGPLDEQATLSGLRRDFPEAFYGGEVNWEKIIRSMYYINLGAEYRKKKIAIELARHFSGSFPVGRRDDEELTAILVELHRRFPYALYVKQVTSQTAPAIMSELARQFSHAFDPTYVDWQQLTFALYDLNEEMNFLRYRFPDAVHKDKLNFNQIQYGLEQEGSKNSAQSKMSTNRDSAKQVERTQRILKAAQARTRQELSRSLVISSSLITGLLASYALMADMINAIYFAALAGVALSSSIIFFTIVYVDTSLRRKFKKLLGWLVVPAFLTGTAFVIWAAWRSSVNRAMGCASIWECLWPF